MNFSNFTGQSNLLIFSKIPRLAPCKTRLIDETLSEDTVYRLAKAFFADTLICALNSAKQNITVATWPLVSAESLFDILDKPDSLALDALEELDYIEQRGESFTQRLVHSVYAAYEKRRSGVVVIGTDSPLVSPHILARSLDLVERGTFVIGPTVGCGIYLIGIPEKCLAQGIEFYDVFSQSNLSELKAFEKLLKNYDVDLFLLEPHIDIDVKSDLVQLLYLLSGLYGELCYTENSSYYGHPRETIKVISELGLQLTAEKNSRRDLELKKLI